MQEVAMPYLSATDWVNSLPAVPTITGSSTVLTIGEVATIIARTSAEIDAAAAQAGYTVPISSTATIGGFAICEELCNYGAGWKVLRTFFPNQGGPGDKNSLAQEYKDAYMAGLLALRKGEQPLLGVGQDSGDTARNLPRSYSTSHPGATAGVRLLSPDMDWIP